MEKRKCEECKRLIRVHGLAEIKGRLLCRDCQAGRNVKKLKKSNSSQNK